MTGKLGLLLHPYKTNYYRTRLPQISYVVIYMPEDNTRKSTTRQFFVSRDALLGHLDQSEGPSGTNIMSTQCLTGCSKSFPNDLSAPTCRILFISHTQKPRGGGGGGVHFNAFLNSFICLIFKNT